MQSVDYDLFVDRVLVSAGDESRESRLFDLDSEWEEARAVGGGVISAGV